MFLLKWWPLNLPSACRNHQVTAVILIRSSLMRSHGCPVLIGPLSTVWTRQCSRTSLLLTLEWFALRTPETYTHTHIHTLQHLYRHNSISTHKECNLSKGPYYENVSWVICCELPKSFHIHGRNMSFLCMQISLSCKGVYTDMSNIKLKMFVCV